MHMSKFRIRNNEVQMSVSTIFGKDPALLHHFGQLKTCSLFRGKIQIFPETRPSLHDYKIGQRDWGHVDWKVNTVISFEDEALPFPPGLIFFMYE